ncbi:MAG: 2,3-bisphosphoglycerate-independent phosphoglycerate mutase [Candidatus Jordarchaeum sp.]|uniref:2,3-bisphosphoglycerate-independent phosphoglycerate mutase n=1 Tax=Candidatus Jordarchaeum sp. TaxID=2823881 RepID=UPI00404A060F
MKALLIVSDGMGDRPNKKLGGKTPLQAAETPNLDYVAKIGCCGIMDTISPGIPPGSDTAHLAIFGYDPYEYYTGRGAFEALGVGIRIYPGDVAFRANFATFEEQENGLLVTDRRAGRKVPEGGKLAEKLNKYRLKTAKDVKFRFEHSVEHRGVLVLSGSGLSYKVSDTDPHETLQMVHECKPLDDSKEALKTAKIVNELNTAFHEILKNNPLNQERISRGEPPANGVLLRGAGILPKVTPLNQMYGVSCSCVAAAALYRGVAAAVGMKLFKAPGDTATYETDEESIARTVLDILPENDLVFIHFKPTDNASHDGNPELKAKMIEKLDNMVGKLVEGIDLENEHYIAVTADHTTPCSVQEHTGEPVPLVMAGPGVRTDQTTAFSEIDCQRGGLGRLRGKDIMPIIMDYLGKTRIFGS